MNLNNYKLLKIPFVSKKRSAEILGNNTTSKYSFEGVAYYIVDMISNCIVWERAFLSKAQCRLTDSSMLTTKHYESYYKSKNINRADIIEWSDIDYVISDVRNETLTKINYYSLHYTKTVLSVEGILTGSNPPGSDRNVAKTPILIDPRIGTDYIRFVNAIKRIRCHDNKFDFALKEVLNEVSDIEKVFPNSINIDELINLNAMFGKWMKIFNSDISEFTEDESGIMEYINELNNKDITNSVEYILSLYENKLIEERNLVEKLRREFRISLLKEAIDNNYSEYVGETKINILDTEAAHILSVKKIMKNNLSYEWIANPNNGLLLNPTIHTLLDKGKIEIDQQGMFFSVAPEYEGQKFQKINDSILNDERRFFINLRKKY